MLKTLGYVRRDDGYDFRLWVFEEGEPKITAGCRFFTVAEFRAHVAAQYPGTPKAVKTLAILDYFDALLAIG